MRQRGHTYDTDLDLVLPHLEVAKVVARMAEAAALAAFDLPSATEASHAVDDRLRVLGISASGWRTAIDLVLDARTAIV